MAFAIFDTIFEGSLDRRLLFSLLLPLVASQPWIKAAMKETDSP